MKSDFTTADYIGTAFDDGGYDSYVSKCPECNASEPEYFYYHDGSVIGCSECIESINPYSGDCRLGSECFEKGD